MPCPRADEHRDDAKDSCGLCHDEFEERIEALELELTALKDKRDELADDLERVSAERDEAKQRYAELVEVTATRTDQAAEGQH